VTPVQPHFEPQLASDFFTRGWCRFPHDPAIAAWVKHVLPVARTTIAAPEHAEWLRYRGTWFAGVNVLGNDATGRTDENSPELVGAPIEFIANALGLRIAQDYAWDRGQLSVCYPGYPQPVAGETTGAHRYRLQRDAAHLDGLLPEGEQRRRHLREHHAFILGIPLTQASIDAAPLVVWDGSHIIVREAFGEKFAGVPPDTWGDIDVTETYQATRRDIFKRCKRTVVHARPGESYLLHRHALHGVAPWSDTATAGPDGRMIAYFRPAASTNDQDCSDHWLTAP